MAGKTLTNDELHAVAEALECCVDWLGTDRHFDPIEIEGCPIGIDPEHGIHVSVIRALAVIRRHAPWMVRDDGRAEAAFLRKNPNWLEENARV